MKQDYYYKLIYQALAGTISPKKQHELEQWCQAHPTHQKEYDELMGVWEESVISPPIPDSNLQPLFQQVRLDARRKEAERQKKEMELP
ncbi:DUF4880 domain-containing protein [Fulvivirga maritima]|uniref:DUF4880 domain-containing protein n=1 Tax=Fulvivirga maritima TaxID=2904247 RepID=UPI001F26B6AF|nr:DUF4880 domain-containing protein [Fulvivirga maritima]UII29094.1 DUF4880 domain-containing protein [Fulvivirga maritima]